MIVDDHKEILELTEDVLSACNYEIETASSGRECLRNVEKFDPDLILLDIMMPGMSGWEVLDELERAGITKTTKIAIFTVKHLWEDDVKRAVSEKKLFYIHKLVGFEELSQKIESIFREETV